MTNIEKRPELKTLTSLRFFAAYWILIYHSYSLIFRYGMEGIPSFLTGIISSSMAVPFFFMLSGYVLQYSYGNQPESSALSFWRRRFARIAPAFYLSLAAGLIPYLQVNRMLVRDPLYVQAGTDLMWNLTFLTAWNPSSMAINPPGWSISVEVFFYLAFPFAMPQLAKLGRTGSALALAACFVAGCAIQWWAAAIFDLSEAGTFAFFQINPLVHFAEFLGGMALAGWAKENRLAPWQNDSLLALGLIFCLVISSIRLPYLWNNSVAGMPGFILILHGGAGRRGRLTRWLEASWLVALGYGSYSLYLFHGPIRDQLSLGGAFAQWPRPLFAAFIFLVLPLASILFFRWYEQPLRKTISGAGG